MTKKKIINLLDACKLVFINKKKSTMSVKQRAKINKTNSVMFQDLSEGSGMNNVGWVMKGERWGVSDEEIVMR